MRILKKSRDETFPAGSRSWRWHWWRWPSWRSCGSSSSKPEYCSNVSNLEGSVEELKGLELQSGVAATLEADLKKVQTGADEVVASAKSDFPSETSAVKSSVSSLSTATQELSAAPSPQELVALGTKVSGVVTATEELSSATESACE